MLRPGRGDRQHIAAQIGLVEPTRYGALQNAAAHAAMAGDDEDAAATGGARARHKAGERAMRLGLGHPVEIEPRLDRALATPEPLGGGAINPGELVERRRGWRGLRTLRLNARQIAGLDRARLGRIAGGTPAVLSLGAAGERRDIACHASPQLRIVRAESAHPRPIRHEGGAGRVRPIGCAARYRRSATGR
jgi:hypothetical protein